MKPDSPTALLLVILSLVLLGALPVELLLATLPAMGEAFGFSLPLAGLTVSLYALGVALAQPLVGALALRYGRKPIMVAGLALAGAAAAAAVMVKQGELLLALRLVQGLGCGSLVLVHGLLGGRDPRSHRLLGLMALGGGLFIAVAPLLGDAVQRHFGWQGVFLIVEFFTLFCVGMLIALLNEEPLASRTGATLGAVRLETCNTAVLGYSLLAALAFSCQFAAALTLVVAGTHTFGFTSTMVALTLLGYGVASLVADILAGALAGRLSGNGQARLGLTIIGLAAALLALSLREASLVWLLGPLIAGTLGASLVRNGATGQALDLAGDRSAAKVIGNTLTFGCAGLLSAVALLADPDTRMGLLVLYVASTLVAALLLAAVSEHTPEQSSTVNL